MNQMIRKSHPSRLFEMGTFDGRTALNMAANSPEDAVVYTLDLPVEKINETALPIASGDAQHIQKDQSGSRYLRTCEKKKIAQLYGDTASFDFSPYFNGMEFVFIDASHSYEYVLNDSRIALRLLKNRRGLILWHDYGTFDGVTKALNELYAGDPQFKGARHIKETSLVCLSL